MNKTLTATSIASLLALSSFGAFAQGPDFYIRADLAVVNADKNFSSNASKDGTFLVTHPSWVGVKGSEKVNDFFDVIYKLEFGVQSFNNTGNTFNARGTYVGLKSDTAGTLVAGRNDTVFKSSEGGIDLFGNTESDIDALVPAQSLLGDGFTYYSPKIADQLTLNATYLVDDNLEDVNDANGEKAHLGSLYAVSATLGDKGLKAQNYFASLSYNSGINNVDAYRAVAQVKLDKFILGGIYQNSKSQIDAREGNAFYVNAAYKSGPLRLKAAIGSDDAGLGKIITRVAKDNGSASDISHVDLMQYSVGADYRLSKNMLAYTHYTQFEGDFMQNNVKREISDGVTVLGMRLDF